MIENYYSAGERLRHQDFGAWPALAGYSQTADGSEGCEAFGRLSG
jgi:hypothetical protein